MADTAKRDSMEVSVDALSKSMHSTTLNESSQSPANNNPKPKSSLTTLPPSIRKTIYKHLLDTELVNAGHPNVSYTATTHSLINGGNADTLQCQFSASRRVFPVATALFYVNTHISREARHFFYARNLFIRLRVCTSDARYAERMMLDSGILFAGKGKEVMERCVQHSLDVCVVAGNNGRECALVMFPAMYLMRLVVFLEGRGGTGRGTMGKGEGKYSVEIVLREGYGFPISRVLGDLLEPFRGVSGLAGVSVSEREKEKEKEKGKGMLVPGYAEGLTRGMMAQAFDAEMWFQDLKALSNHAEHAIEKEDWAMAVQLYQTVIIALTHGYLTRADQLHSQPEAFSRSIQRLRWTSELGAGLALLAQHEPLLETNKTSEFADWLSDPSIPFPIRANLAKALLESESHLYSALSLSSNSPSTSSNPWLRTLPAALVPPNHHSFFSDAEVARSWMACGKIHAALREDLFAAGDMERACAGFGVDGLGDTEVESLFRGMRERVDFSVCPGMGLRRAGRLARSVVEV